MILDKIKRLADYDGVLSGAMQARLMLRNPDFNPDDAGTHEGFEVRHKQYETKADAQRQFETHAHTIDLMVCLSGREIIHVCDESELAPGAALPNGADGMKMVGGPRGSACVLEEGMFIALFPGEAHMVGGQVEGKTGTVDKLVIKIPVALPKGECPCESDCLRHGNCAQCVVWHRSPTNSLPTCLRPKGQLLVDRALNQK